MDPNLRESGLSTSGESQTSTFVSQIKGELPTQSLQALGMSSNSNDVEMKSQTQPTKDFVDTSSTQYSSQLAHYQAQVQAAQAQLQAQSHVQTIQSQLPVSVSQEDLRQFQSSRMSAIPGGASQVPMLAGAYTQNNTVQQQYAMQLQLGMNQFASQQNQAQTPMYLPPSTPYVETTSTPLLPVKSAAKRRNRDTPQSGGVTGGAEPFYYPDGSYTRCLCDENQRDDGVMIQCENCDGWQHAECVGVDENQIPEQYYCELCKPDHPIHVARRKNAPNGVFFSRKPIKVVRSYSIYFGEYSIYLIFIDTCVRISSLNFENIILFLYR